ncbi:EpsG family protein [Limnohabitans sp. TS-CS-82]|uniref:EpsG family protein n=1 Tax=Limnohabitans sp. TS-CS-82 TaxID=2094193 RepID=UPI000CF29B54|nr:EpsG family protein [Limnohabitans sp. TS-CS-82]PQA81808.1 EpsG family protein [Limnohabitans sp. TS-CS-82]
MWAYFLLPSLVFWPALNERPKSPLKSFKGDCNLYWFFVAFCFCLFIGWRHEVGGDWISYLGHVAELTGEKLIDVHFARDPAYALLNWFGANIFGGVYFANLASAFIFTYGLFLFCKNMPRPWLAISVSIPYLVTVVAMGYTRQGVAIGLAMIAMTKLLGKVNVWEFIFWIALAATFHKSAVILIPIALLAKSRRRWLTLLMVGITAPLLFFLLLQESLDGLIHGYIDAEYASSGAGIRVAMNAVPGIFFLIFRNKFSLSHSVRVFWSWISILAILFIIILLMSPSSTAVDRIALYWIPLQIFVWSHFPDVFGKKGKRNSMWVGAVLVYGLSVMTVWLFFAQHSFAWLPYQFYPWIWFWQ